MENVLLILYDTCASMFSFLFCLVVCPRLLSCCTSKKEAGFILLLIILMLVNVFIFHALKFWKQKAEILM